MKKLPIAMAPLCGILLLSAACSPGPRSADNGAEPRSAETTDLAGGKMAVPPSRTGTGLPATPAEESARPDILTLDGLGGLTIGQPVPAAGSWAERGAQTGDACRTVSSPDYPGAYAIVTDGKVQRITLGQRSKVKLAEGIGVGASEADVKKWFAGFGDEPHKYEEAPAKYLTAPNAAKGSSALRFEIGQDGKVKMIHVGLMPVLAYVEGCG